MEPLEKVFDKLSPAIFAVSLAILKSREEAEDAVQEIFVSKIPLIMQKYPDLPFDELARMLMVTARNYSIDVYRRRKKSVSLDPDRHAAQTDKSSCEEYGYDLKRSLDQLEPCYREVLTFKYLWGMTWQEVSKKIGISVQGVRKRAGKALGFLRSKLGTTSETQSNE